MAKKKEAVKRDSAGRFVASGNPAGRPKGSKNRVTLLKLMAEESVREKNIDQMLQVADLVVQQALAGDEKSQKLVWDAIMSKGTADDKTQAKERVEINIGGTALAPPEVKEVSEITVIEQEPKDGE